MKMQFKRRVIDLDFYGEMVKVRFPSLEEITEYESNILDVSKSVEDTTHNFLDDLGLSKEKAKTIEMPDLQDLMALLQGQKKST